MSYTSRAHPLDQCDCRVHRHHCRIYSRRARNKQYLHPKPNWTRTVRLDAVLKHYFPAWRMDILVALPNNRLSMWAGCPAECPEDVAFERIPRQISRAGGDDD